MSDDNECQNCAGTGYVCDLCNQSSGDCQCDEADEDSVEVECPECDGQGTVE